MGDEVADRVHALDDESCVSHGLLHEASTRTLVARGSRNSRDRNLVEQGLLVIELQVLQCSLDAGITQQQVDGGSPIKAAASQRFA